MIRKITLLTIFIISYVLCFAQQHKTCGTSPETLQRIQQKLIRNKANLQQTPRSSNRGKEDIFIPLKFHLVGTDEGTGRADGDEVIKQVCSLNEVFQEFGVQFYLKDGLSIINSTSAYEAPASSATGKTLMREMVATDAINIFLTDNADNPLSQDGPGTTLGYYTNDDDWIVVNRRNVGNGDIALAHELGHFFNLPHPFFGWEVEPYNSTAPAGAQSPGGINAELADGSNCETAGDRICDTPADYLFFNEIDYQNCVYKKPMIDVKGDTLQADASLIMGYFLGECATRFTPMQVALMVEDLNSPERAYLNDPNYTPVIADLSAAVINEATIFPADDSDIPVDGSLTITWDAVEGANSYYFESSITGFESIVVSEPSVTVAVEVGKPYGWKIKPLNDSDYCAKFTPEFGLLRFNTTMISSVPTIGSIDEWVLQPNPLSAQSDLLLTISANERFNASITIRTSTGAAVQTIPTHTFNTGRNVVKLAGADLPAGLYLVAIENERGVSQKKVVVY